MKTRRWMRCLAAIMALALVMATPLQASEFVTEDMTEAVPVVAPDDAAAEEELSSEEDIIVEETDLAEAISAESTAPAAEISEEDTTLEITDIAEMDSFDSKGTTIGTTSATFLTGVWLHVVHGNFSGNYSFNSVEKDHNEGEEDISKMPSIWVQKKENWFLPDLTNLEVTRSNGTFAGWYTEAPTEELQSKGDYSVWHTVKTNGKKIKPGDVIPEGVRVLYAAFKDKEEVQDSDKLVTFYLDWNGINGQFGHCLTCIRGYKDGQRPMFTAKDAAVYNLNFETDNLGQFESGLTWEDLRNHWKEKTFDGYTFKGWATTPNATEEDLIWKDTKIENGASFYAVWMKGGESNTTFERVDPEAGPLKAIRIMAGNGTTFTSGTLSAGKHGLKGASFTLNLFRVPVRAEEKEITWTLEITEGLKEGGTLADVFKPKKGSIEVKGGTTSSTSFYSVDGEKALQVDASGNTLTVKNLDGKARSIVVSASAPGVDEEKNPITVTSPASATLCFSHSWKVTSQGQPGCTKCGTIHYTCTECKAEEIETTAALGHFYKTGVENNPGQENYYEVVKQPTCMTPGTKQYICQRCGETNGGTVSIPATGHCWGEWEVTKEPTVSETGVKTRSCEHCEEQETEVLPQLVAALQDSQPGNDEVDEDDPANNSVPTPEVKSEDNTQNGTTENEAKTGDPVQDDEQTGKDTVNSAPTISAPTSYATNSVVKTVSAGKSVAKAGWQKVGKKKYYYVNGVKQTGWQKIGKKKYYFNKNGVMQTGWKTIGKKKYYFGKNGVMRTGKQKIGKKIYVFGKNGALKK